MIKSLVKNTAKRFGKNIVDSQIFETLIAQSAETRAFLDVLLECHAPGARSHAQLRQDIVALAISGFKRGGYFVEFGATNGRDLSNSLLLEERFGWTGLLAEPGRNWHAALASNRRCAIDKRCVWHTTGQSLEFVEAEVGEFSTIAAFSDIDRHAAKRAGGDRYRVDTVSLSDLLDQHNAPAIIDYLSIDTEGSELDILRSFDFTSRDIMFISCEHNHTESRAGIYDLLSKAGYRRIMTGLSDFDDWYVRVRPGPENGNGLSAMNAA